MKTLIAIPCGDMCSTDFLRALLSMEIVGEAQFTFAQSSLIYDARNNLADVAINENFDRVLWLDSDMVFPADLMKRFSADLDEGMEMVTGVYVSRKAPIAPVLYETLEIKREGDKKWVTPIHIRCKTIYAEPFEVAGCGFGAVMMTVDLLRRVKEQLGLPFTPAVGFGEDLSFCLRAREVGAKIICDPRPQLAHVGLRYFTVHDMEGANG